MAGLTFRCELQLTAGRASDSSLPDDESSCAEQCCLTQHRHNRFGCFDLSRRAKPNVRRMARRANPDIWVFRRKTTPSRHDNPCCPVPVLLRSRANGPGPSLDLDRIPISRQKILTYYPQLANLAPASGWVGPPVVQPICHFFCFSSSRFRVLYGPPRAVPIGQHRTELNRL